LHTGNSFCSFIAYLKNKFVGALPQIVNPAKGREPKYQIKDPDLAGG
jgi:hypothetical protein